MSDLASSHMSKPGEAEHKAGRKPLQARSQKRVDAALETAERMLATLDPEEVSIPEIAKEAGVPRASLYQFFPNKYVLLAQLAEQQLGQVAAAVSVVAANSGSRNWKDLVRELIQAASAYYNRSALASKLILGGPFSRTAYLAQTVTIEHIGREVRAAVARLDPTLHLPEDPDVVTLAVEVTFACLKHGYYREGVISQPIQEQAIQVALAYLSSWETGAATVVNRC